MCEEEGVTNGDAEGLYLSQLVCEQSALSSGNASSVE